MAPSEPPARIHLLGRFSVEVHGRAIPASEWRKRRPLEVLTSVALSPARVLHREELIDRLWPERDLDAGANNLHRALHDLRRVAGTELVQIERGSVRLAEGVFVDVVAFERAAASIERTALTEAAELYAGPLLPDDPYSDVWSSRREGLRQRFVDVALRLAKLHHEANDREACVAVLRRALDEDATLEPAHQLLMRTLAEMGRTSDALRQFAECTAALRERLDAAPSRASNELRLAIERGELLPRSEVRAADPPAPPADIPQSSIAGACPLVGRAAELTTVEGWVEGGRGVLLVLGEAGLGKTRIAQACVAMARRMGASTLVGVGLDASCGVPYAPFADAWATHRRSHGASDALDPFQSFSPSGGSAQEDRLRLYQSVERSLETLAQNGPVCLVIEDLHEADQSSLHLFHHLARMSRTMALLLVGTFRDEEVRVGRPLHTLLGSLGRERLSTRVTLERLDREATGRLVAQLLGATPDAATVAEVYALAEGNPFHTEEVVHAMRDAGATKPVLPANLLEIVLYRVRRLGREEERLFSAAALVGLRFGFEVARTAAGLEAEPALQALEAGLDARIVEEDAGEYRFRHALSRQALVGALTHARKVYLHRAIAEAIEKVDDPRRDDRAAVLASHHEGAGQLERALPHLRVAAERAQSRLGFTEAIGFYERILALLDATGSDSGAERFRALRTVGGMRMALSDLDGAVRDLDTASSLSIGGWRPSAGEIASTKRIAALALIQGGRLAEAGVRLEDAVAALAESKDDPELPSVLYLFAQLRWHEERYADAKELAQRSLAEATARGDRPAISKGHEMLALVCHSLGAWHEGHDHERERQAFADGRVDVDQAFDVHLCLWEYHLYGDQNPTAFRGTVDLALEQARRMNAPRAVALCESFAGTLDFQAGRWDAAEGQLARAVEGFRRVGSASGEALSLQRLAVLLTARGRLDEARGLLDQGLVVGERAAMRAHCLTRIHASLARNRLAARDRDAARTSLDEGLAEAARHGHCATCSALLLPEAVRVELAWDDPRAAESFAAEFEAVADRFRSRTWTAMAAHARARVLAARGDRALAMASFDRARLAFEDVSAPYEAARCAMAASRIELDAATAATLAASAESSFHRLGATALEV